MNIEDLKISIIPFKGDNFVESKQYLIGRVINYKPISEEGINNILKNENNIAYNTSGIRVICSKVLSEDTIEILYGKFKLDGLLTGVNSVYEIIPNFTDGQRVESLNGTIRQGYINHIVWHGKDKEFKYFIEDLNGKKISRQYTAKELRIVDS